MTGRLWPFFGGGGSTTVPHVRVSGGHLTAATLLLAFLSPILDAPLTAAMAAAEEEVDVDAGVGPRLRGREGTGVTTTEAKLDLRL